jgi:hypothetical protein
MSGREVPAWLEVGLGKVCGDFIWLKSGSTINKLWLGDLG